MNTDRTVLHSDCNSFFASVECVSNPELKRVPMAVAGSVEKRHGIILAKNDLAKKYKIQTAEPIWKAKQKCPELVIVQPNYSEYVKYSRAVNEIYLGYTDLVERFGIDESWLDVTGSRRLFGDGKTIAEEIRNKIKNELGITVSIGVSFNKIFAKLGSDYKKPDAVTLIPRDGFERIVYPLPVSDLLFVGKRACDALFKMNIRTIGDLANADEGFVTKKLGKNGSVLIRYARGEDNEPVKPFGYEEEIKSVGRGRTFTRDLVGLSDIKKGVYVLSDEISMQLRKKGIKCTTVQVHIKDTQLKTISRQMTLEKPTFLMRDISEAAIRLIVQNWDMEKPIRQITVTGTNITGMDSGIQLSLFDSAQEGEKHEKLEDAIENIRKKFGTDSVMPASIIKNDIGIEYKNR